LYGEPLKQDATAEIAEDAGKQSNAEIAEYAEDPRNLPSVPGDPRVEFEGAWQD
jgi:hypothetical protein